MATRQPEVAGTAGSEHHEAIDWEAAERSPEFRRLVETKRRFVVPATIFFFVWYFGFIALAGWAPDFMGQSIYQGLTIGYVLALTQFLMTWGLGYWYLKRSDRDFDPLARAAADRAAGRPDEATATPEGGVR